ncbi:SAP30-binding protein [Trichogramma pretiosum]|uniref:SAP30-binding protein n=1 Tax=Trichogramma pretiosum TaxID=7493 RepID=UPI0006C97B1D|nr:SAP30-binding protein [Trichogramma pretiosum]
MSVTSKALASLTATYTDSEGEEEETFENNSNTPKESAPQNEDYQISNSSKSDSSNTNSPNNSFPNKSNNSFPSKGQRLVSYFDDTVVSDDDENPSSNSDGVLLNGKQPNELADPQSPHIQEEVISDNEADAYGVVIPPEPAVKCPSELQDKILNLYKRMESGRSDMNKIIQHRKDFRNPSIYEKLIQFCSINELGTNFSSDRFDPFKWGKESFYEELTKQQKIEMEKLEKARKEKTKIEIVSGTAKRPNPTPITVLDDEAKKRKSKWDQVSSNAAGAGPVSKLSSISQPTLSLTSSGTKTTVISAFGSLPKKRL